MGGSSDSGSGNTKFKPWEGAYPYIVGVTDKGNRPIPGVYGAMPLAAEVFGLTAKSPPQEFTRMSRAMYDIAQQYAGVDTGRLLNEGTSLLSRAYRQTGVDPRAVLSGGLRSRLATPQAALTAGTTLGDAIRSGVLSPVVTTRRLLDTPISAADIKGLSQNLGVKSGEPLLAKLATRPIDPKQAEAMYRTLATQTGVRQALSGVPNNPWLRQAAESNINAAQRAFNDQVSNLQNALLPRARGEALRAGQYGSNRQALLESLLASQTLTQGRRLLEAGQEQAAKVYASAYENAARNQAALAGQLADISGRGSIAGSTLLGGLAQTGLQGFYNTLSDTLNTRKALTSDLLNAAQQQQLALANLQTKADLGQLGLASQLYLASPGFMQQLYELPANDQLRRLGMLETAQNASVAPLDLRTEMVQNYVSSIAPFTGAGSTTSFAGGGLGGKSRVSSAIGGGLSGAAAGAMAGAAKGSIGGGWGALIGGILGALGGALS